MQDNNSQNRGNEFWDVVQNAINTGDYRELSDKVKDTVNVTADEIRNIKDDFLDSFFGSSTSRTPTKTNKSYYEQSQWNSGRNSANQTTNHSPRNSATTSGANSDAQTNYNTQTNSGAQTNYNVRPNYNTRTKVTVSKPKYTLYAKNPQGKVSGLVQMILGFGMVTVALPADIILFTALMAFSGVGSSILSALAIVLMSVFLGGGVVLGVMGLKKWNFVKRFQEYVKIVGNRGYCEIKEIQQRTGRTKNAIIKDLKRMIGQRMFLQGHLDQKETCLMVTHDMYKQYLDVEKQAKERALLQQAEQARLNQIPEACRTILEEGKAYILFIRDCNDKLPGEVISTKLDRLELIITRIFAEVEAKPALAGDLRRFMNYYLPTTKKLVQAYYDLEQEPISSENMMKTKKEIEDTLDTINQAFENLLNSFFDTKALDISSDISALNTMLAQEGLTKTEFEMKK